MTAGEPYYNWDDHRTEILKALWAEGLSGEQIAQRLPGYPSRNAVIGKAHRLGLGNRRGVRTRIVKDNPHNAAQLARRAQPRPALAADPAPAGLRKGAFAPIGGFRPVPFIDLAPGACRWPIEGYGADMLCCGAPQADERPYCATHERIAHQPPSTTERVDQRLGISKLRAA